MVGPVGGLGGGVAWRDLRPVPGVFRADLQRAVLHPAHVEAVGQAGVTLGLAGELDHGPPDHLLVLGPVHDPGGL